jgi:hypothetical protein
MGFAARENNCIVEDLHEQIDKLSVLLRQVDGVVAEVEESQLIEYAIEDFVRNVMWRLHKEEKALRTSRSSGFTFCMTQCQFFASQVNLLEIAFSAGQLTLAKSVLDFMQTWLDYNVFQEESSHMALVSNM